MKISIIIPIYNEEKQIKSLIDNLKILEGDFEVIFSDGGSTDDTLSIIGNDYTVIHSKKGRANQMNFGSEYTTGDILFFLHCDSTLEKDALTKIIDKINEGYSVGCFKLRFDSKNIWMKVCAYFSNLRVKLRCIAFGDQGIFIKKEVFYDIGMFPDIPIMEDYQLSIYLKEKYKICQVNSKITTSSRRFLDTGIFKTMWKMQKLQRMFRNGEDINLISKMYRDIR